MSTPDKQDIFRIVTTILLSLLSVLAGAIYSSQRDIVCRLRIVEINQARLMERMGIEKLTYEPGSRPEVAAWK